MRLLKKNDYILGQVFDSIGNIVIISIKKTMDKKIILPSIFGVLHISEIDNRFIKNIKDEYKIGDIVKLRVKEITKWGINLSSKGDEESGVILGFCSNCREQLVKEGDHLKCLNCGNIEYRKIAINYGKMEEYYGALEKGK